MIQTDCVKLIRVGSGKHAWTIDWTIGWDVRRDVAMATAYRIQPSQRLKKTITQYITEIYD